MGSLSIDADIRKARTLKSDFYTDPAWFELSKEKIFARSWQFFGQVGDIDSLKPVTVLPELLGEPLLLSKVDSSVRCLSNVCTHRGKVLVEEPCKGNLIRCGYHGRRFSLDGEFLSMPEFEGVEDFPSESDDLSQIPFAEWLGFGFASLDPFKEFSEFADDAMAAIGEIPIDGLTLTSTREYEIDAHWALYCENYLEGFHIPYVHQSLNAIVDYGSYTTETFRYSVLQTGRSSTTNGKPQEIAASYLFIFPNLMFNFYPWGISVNVVRPVSPSKSIVEFLTYVRDESLIESSAGADLHGVEMEDEAVVESVQKGIRSRFYSHGRYSPNREQGTHHFHRLISEFMS
ncbi:MAG: SRPBCC family protein [Pyrinomonadaceae bacterium]